jgi:hypothetical protein
MHHHRARGGGGGAPPSAQTAHSFAVKRFYVWELSLWERVNGWFFAVALVLALLLLAAYTNHFVLRYALWMLIPQLFYVGLTLDTLYMHSTTVQDGETRNPSIAENAVHSITRRGAFVRVVAGLAAIGTNVALVILMFVYGFSRRELEPTRLMRVTVPAVFYCTLAAIASLILFCAIQLLGIYVGWPYSAAQKRALRLRMAKHANAAAVNGPRNSSVPAA